MISDLSASDVNNALSAISQKSDRDIMIEYGSVGARHLQHLADMASLSDDALRVHASEIAVAITATNEETLKNLKNLLAMHSQEWQAFLSTQGENHPLPRRIQSAAHELGHFYGTRRNPEVLEEDEKFLSRDERYANAFGRAFLTPVEGFSESFRQLKEITGKTTRRLLILLSQQYGISRQACCLRLEELGLTKKGTWAWFENNGGITEEHVREVLGVIPDRVDPAKSDAAHH